MDPAATADTQLQYTTTASGAFQWMSSRGEAEGKLGSGQAGHVDSWGASSGARTGYVPDIGM